MNVGRNTKLSDSEVRMIIDAYSEAKSISKVRNITGYGNKTIYKYLKLNGITLNKRGCSGGSERKITDEELYEEAKTMTRVEIAKKHGMNVCNVDRKLKRLNIKCKESCGTGSGKNHYLERCKSYDVEYDESIDLFEVMKREDGICAICGRKVDVNDKGVNRIGKLYPTIDHIQPLSKGGSHTWGNVQLAHMVCNSRKGDRVV